GAGRRRDGARLGIRRQRGDGPVRRVDRPSGRRRPARLEGKLPSRVRIPRRSRTDHAASRLRRARALSQCRERRAGAAGLAGRTLPAGLLVVLHRSRACWIWLRRLLADFAALPPERLGSAYGVFGAAFGIAWFAGSAALGALYDFSVTATVVLAVVSQLVAVIPIAIAARSIRNRS